VSTSGNVSGSAFAAFTVFVLVADVFVRDVVFFVGVVSSSVPSAGFAALAVRRGARFGVTGSAVSAAGGTTGSVNTGCCGGPAGRVCERRPDGGLGKSFMVSSLSSIMLS
jgi:hypothetical protein